MHMAEMMYGKPVADRIEQGVRAEIEQLLKNHNVIPRLGSSPVPQLAALIVSGQLPNNARTFH